MSDPCPLCQRPLNPKTTQLHHLIPKCKKGKDLVPLHPICHRKIHSVFTETELEQYYHTIERLMEHSDIIKFVKWVSKKPIDFYSSSKNVKGKKRRR